MSCVQITSCKLASSSYTFPRKAFHVNGGSHTAVFLGTKIPNLSLKLTSTKSRHQQWAPVCLFGDKGNQGNANEASPWKAIEKVTGIFKKKSVEDLLKEQIVKKEFYGDGGSGKEQGPPGGGGGAGGDGFGGFGEASDDESWEEFGQKTMAVLALLFLYAYILNGETITVLSKDILKFIFIRQQSFRLKRLIKKWKKFFESMQQEEDYGDPNWLEKEILCRTTMYDSPAKYKKILKILTPKDESEPPKQVKSEPPKQIKSSRPEFNDDSGPPDYYDDSGPPEYVVPNYPDDDDQYAW